MSKIAELYTREILAGNVKMTQVPTGLKDQVKETITELQKQQTAG